jgi:hypothetical protein
LTEDLFSKINFKINRQNCRILIKHAASEIRKKIALEVKNKLFSIKIDITTRHGKHILGITLQFSNEGKIVTRCVGMIEFFTNHNNINITQEVIKCLDSIECVVNQIYAIAIDNARNMVSTVDRVRFTQDNANYEPVDETIEEDDTAELQLENFMRLELKGLCSCVRCSSHTIELCAKDVIEIFERDLNVIRKYIKRLKNIDFVQVFRDENVPRPFLDTITRWNSTYLVFLYLHQHRNFLRSESFGALQISDYYWDFIAEVVQAFNPIFLISKESQTSHYTYGENFLEIA